MFLLQILILCYKDAKSLEIVVWSLEVMHSLLMEQLHDGWPFKLLEDTTLTCSSISIELDMELIQDLKIQLDILY